MQSPSSGTPSRPNSMSRRGFTAVTVASAAALATVTAGPAGATPTVAEDAIQVPEAGATLAQR
ncbi:hypothetical protein, partial [Streptomyces melanogenes]